MISLQTTQIGLGLKAEIKLCVAFYDHLPLIVLPGTAQQNQGCVFIQIYKNNVSLIWLLKASLPKYNLYIASFSFSVYSSMSFDK